MGIVIRIALREGHVGQHGMIWSVVRSEINACGAEPGSALINLGQRPDTPTKYTSIDVFGEDES